MSLLLCVKCVMENRGSSDIRRADVIHQGDSLCTEHFLKVAPKLFRGRRK